MKKLICALLLVVTMTSLLTACGKFECGMCGEKKSGKKYETELLGTICKDCKEGLESLSNLFG